MIIIVNVRYKHRTHRTHNKKRKRGKTNVKSKFKKLYRHNRLPNRNRFNFDKLRRHRIISY